MLIKLDRKGGKKMFNFEKELMNLFVKFNKEQMSRIIKRGIQAKRAKELKSI